MHANRKQQIKNHLVYKTFFIFKILEKRDSMSDIDRLSLRIIISPRRSFLLFRRCLSSEIALARCFFVCHTLKKGKYNNWKTDDGILAIFRLFLLAG